MSRDTRNEQMEHDEELAGGDERFGSRLSGALGAAAESFPPAAPDLVRRAAVRGRRMRRVRAAQVAGAAAVTVSLAAVGIGVGAGAFAGGGGPSGPAGPAVSGARRAGPAVSDAEMAATLEKLMPQRGSVTGASGRGTPSPPGSRPLTARLTYAEGHGISGVDVSVARPAPGFADQDPGSGPCLPIEVRPYGVCTTKTLRSGSTLSLIKSFSNPNSTAGRKAWSAVLTTPGDAQITVEEYGGGGEKETASNVTPLLSAGELSAVATSTKSDKAVASIPVPAPGGSPGPSPDAGVPAGQRMAAVLNALLPGDAGTRSDWSTGEGRAETVYDDGHGRTAVAVNAQVSMGDVASSIMTCSDARGGSCTMSTLSDGTRIRTSEEPSERGGKAVVWQVDTLHSDGRRVLVREINSYAESGPVTRSQPALSPARLRAIALSPDRVVPAG
jgi:hypothetical protein